MGERNKPMMLSEVVEQLAGFLESCGDMPVYLVDADTGFEWKARPHHFGVEDGELLIGGDYSDQQRDRTSDTGASHE